MEDSKESRLRAEFEAWARRSGWVYLARRGDEGRYVDFVLEESWQAWQAASASRSEILEALKRLLRNFPTEGDMADAGWNSLVIEAACLAHNHAREVFAKYQGE